MTQVRADPTYLSDPELSEYLNRLGYTLVSRANTHTYNFFFFPIRDETLNAFALPGGFLTEFFGFFIYPWVFLVQFAAAFFQRGHRFSVVFS